MRLIRPVVHMLDFRAVIIPHIPAPVPMSGVSSYTSSERGAATVKGVTAEVFDAHISKSRSVILSWFGT